jgi:hypothetical protein
MALALLVLAAGGRAQQNSLTTTFEANNSLWGNMFNLETRVPLTLDSFDVHFDDGVETCGPGCYETEVEVWVTEPNMTWKPGPEGWQLLGRVQHSYTTGAGIPQPLNLPLNIPLDPEGTRELGFYVTSTGPTNSVTGKSNSTMRYLNAPAAVVFANKDLSFHGGVGVTYPFGWGPTGLIFWYRIWNGTVYYTLDGSSGSGTTYCTAGTSASGCQAVLSSWGTASASAGSGFRLTAIGSEGGKTGLFFFGANGRQANPWGNGTSYQCVTPPVQRAGLLAENGSPGACDGGFLQDLNALWCPTCPAPTHNPGAGAVVQAQLWYRDPLSTSNQTTSLSDALEFVVTL